MIINQHPAVDRHLAAARAQSLAAGGKCRRTHRSSTAAVTDISDRCTVGTHRRQTGANAASCRSDYHIAVIRHSPGKPGGGDLQRVPDHHELRLLTPHGRCSRLEAVTCKCVTLAIFIPGRQCRTTSVEHTEPCMLSTRSRDVIQGTAEWIPERRALSARA